MLFNLELLAIAHRLAILLQTYIDSWARFQGGSDLENCAYSNEMVKITITDFVD